MSLLLTLLLLSASPRPVVCFGDSTTAPRNGVVTYCEMLGAVNRGVPGNTTADARRRFERDVLSLNPSLVIIQFGLNDSTVDVWKNPPATAPRVSLDDYKANLAYFISQLRSKDAQVILMTFNPLTWTPKLRDLYQKPPYETDLNEGRTPYLNAIRELATQHKLPLIDVNTLFTNPETLLLDGMHPNSAGHRLIFEQIKKARPREELQ